MRPKIISLLAVSAVALVGCASAEPATTPDASVSVVQESPSAEPTSKPKSTVNPNAQIEKQFAEFAELRAATHGVSEAPSAKDSTKALHAYCEDGKRIKVSESQVLNKNLEVSAEKAYCDFLK